MLNKDLKLYELSSKQKIEDIFDNKKYAFVDNGMDEIIIPREYIPDFIVGANQNLKIFDVNNDPSEILSTIGMFLNRCASTEIRNEFIERLISLQLGDEKPRKIPYIPNYLYNLIDEHGVENGILLYNDKALNISDNGLEVENGY